MRPSPTFRMLSAVAALALASASSLALAGQEQPGTPHSPAPVDLRAGFTDPPAAARPRVWWHWMNGNVTEEGIEADLQWFARIGVGGFTAFDGAMAVPRFVDRPLTYMSPGWKQAFRHAMRTADRLGLEASIAASPGWSQTGGPWVKPEQAMKKMVWSETAIVGGRRTSIVLPQPPTSAGDFGDLVARSPVPVPPFYRDARVFAYRSPAPLPRPSVTTSALVSASGAPDPAPLDPARLFDGSLRNPVYLAEPAPSARPSITLDYGRPVTASGLTIASGDPFQPGYRPELGPIARIEASEDGRTFRTLAEGIYVDAQRTYAFARTTARAFRVSFGAGRPPFPGYYRGPPAPTRPGAIKTVATNSPPGPPPPRRTVAISEIALRQAPVVNRFEVKAGFGIVNDFDAVPTPQDAGSGVTAGDVVDLTGRMAPDGTLDWTPPAGHWTVVRLGYGLTGKENGPASAEATGLEVDKLNAAHVRAYMQAYLGMYADAAGADLMGARGLSGVLNDSYEARFQNWTEDMPAQFQRLRGYDPGPWLPVLTGIVVDTPERSDRFLWDWRRTIAELLATEHYGTIADEAHKRGMRHYAEALEDSRAYPGDDMEMRRFADVPMGASGVGGAFPAEGILPPRRRLVDNHGAASVAHVYGRDLAAAEAFTAAPLGAMPQQLKTLADMFFVEGINRLFIHTSAHQPTSQGPGVSLNNIGHFFTRNETWADVAKPWVDYLARASFMLQQGRYVADLAYFYGEEAPITGVWGGDPQLPLPEGHGYDFVNADVVRNLLRVEDGMLVTPSGMRYAALYLGGRSSRMTLPVARRLLALVRDGATLIGERPTGSPSLADDDRDFAAVTDELWGDGRAGVRAVGRGRVFVGRRPADALIEAGVARDVDYATEYKEEPLASIHRRTGDADIYFVANQGPADFAGDLSFRVSGRAVELWDAVSGTMTPASYRTERGRTIVPVALNRGGSVFVVMRGDGPPSRSLPTPSERTVAVADPAWTVAFQPDRGAPASIRLPFLQPLNESTTAGVRYFSGTAAYQTSLTAPARAPAGGYRLDLGEVRDIARVFVNGEDMGIVWRSPFQLDVTRAIRPGRNSLRVEVTNSWKNRIIGDQQPGMKQVTFGPSLVERADMPLARAGLIGPVRLVAVEP